MKVNEVMIGDWVYNKHHGKNIRLTQYDFFTHTHNEFDEQELAPFAKPTSGRDLEPIPLTPEILEKNGFIYDGGIFYCDNEDDNYQMDIHPKETNYTGKYTFIGIEKGCITLTELPITYVHQLQHAMRICGIEKEIEL